MRIVLIGPAPPHRGGIADTQYTLGLALESEGHDVEIIGFQKLYPNFLFPGKNQYADDYPIKNIIPKLWIHSYFPWKWRAVSKKIEMLQADIILFRYYTPFLAPVYGYLAKKLSNKSVAIALVDNWRPHESKPWDGLMNQYFGKKMSAFITMSENVSNQIQSELRNKPVLTGFHPMNDDLPLPISKEIAREKLGWDAKAKVVLFFGLIRSYKGLDLLLEAFAKTQKNQSNLRLAIIGECYENTSKYQTIIERLGIRNRIYVDFSFANRQKVQHIFSAADFVVQPYRKATQSGITPWAYHFNKPLLVTDVAGLKDPILKDKTGMVVRPQTEALSEGLESMLSSTTLARFERNIEKVKPSYNWTLFAKEMTTFFKKLP